MHYIRESKADLRGWATGHAPPELGPQQLPEVTWRLYARKPYIGQGPTKGANSVPQILYSCWGGSWLPPLSALGDSPLTRNEAWPLPP